MEQTKLTARSFSTEKPDFRVRGGDDLRPYSQYLYVPMTEASSAEYPVPKGGIKTDSDALPLSRKGGSRLKVAQVPRSQNKIRLLWH